MADEIHLSHLRQVHIIPEQTLIDNICNGHIGDIRFRNACGYSSWPALLKYEFHELPPAYKLLSSKGNYPVDVFSRKHLSGTEEKGVSKFRIIFCEVVCSYDTCNIEFSIDHLRIRTVN